MEALKTTANCLAAPLRFQPCALLFRFSLGKIRFEGASFPFPHQGAQKMETKVGDFAHLARRAANLN